MPSASSVFATSSNPEVSRSSRWTRPGAHAFAGQRCDVREQRVDQRAVGRAVRGMRHHAGRLVDDQQVVVFVDDVERDRFGLGAERARRLDRVLDAVAGLEQRARLPGAPLTVAAPARSAAATCERENPLSRVEQDVEPRPARRRRRRRGSGAPLAAQRARTSSATPTVMQASATLNTFGQIVRKSMKSTTHWCWKRSTMLPIAPPTIIPNAMRTTFECRTASRNA